MRLCLEIIPVTLKYAFSWFDTDSWHKTQFQNYIKMKSTVFQMTGQLNLTDFSEIQLFVIETKTSWV